MPIVIKKGWNEFAMKNIMHLIKDDEMLQQYLPFEDMLQNRFPNKEFFWSIAFTVNPLWAE